MSTFPCAAQGTTASRHRAPTLENETGPQSAGVPCPTTAPRAPPGLKSGLCPYPLEAMARSRETRGARPRAAGPCSSPQASALFGCNLIRRCTKKVHTAQPRDALGPRDSRPRCRCALRGLSRASAPIRGAVLDPSPGRRPSKQPRRGDSSPSPPAATCSRNDYCTRRTRQCALASKIRTRREVFAKTGADGIFRVPPRGAAVWGGNPKIPGGLRLGETAPGGRRHKRLLGKPVIIG